MKTAYIRDFEPNDRITSFFLVQSKEVRTKKNSGEPYLSLNLGDRTGLIEAKMWDGVEEIADTFDADDIVKVKAAIQVYRDKPQMVIQKLRRAEDSEVDLGDFIPHTERDIDEMFAELHGAVEGFENPHLRALVLAFLDDSEIAERFKIAPAAKTLHHAFVGGLLEHVLSLFRLARLVASNYDYLDLELIQTGVVLHDIGKIEELTYGRSFGYSEDGQLLGHITIALQWIDRRCAALPDFPPKLRRLVEHLVLSHHGKYEFGSPKLPMFPEALALAYIDDLDSKLESMRASIAAETGPASAWTRYNPSLERRVLNSALFVADPPPADPPPLPSVSAPELPGPQPEEGANESTGSAPSLFGEKLMGALGTDPGPEAGSEEEL